MFQTSLVSSQQNSMRDPFLSILRHFVKILFESILNRLVHVN